MLCSIAKLGVATYLQIVNVFTVNDCVHEAIFGTRVCRRELVALKKPELDDAIPAYPSRQSSSCVTTTQPKSSKSPPQISAIGANAGPGELDSNQTPVARAIAKTPAMIATLFCEPRNTGQRSSSQAGETNPGPCICCIISGAMRKASR